MKLELLPAVAPATRIALPLVVGELTRIIEMLGYRYEKAALTKGKEWGALSLINVFQRIDMSENRRYCIPI